MSVPRGCRLQAAAAVVPSDGDAVSIFVRRETAVVLYELVPSYRIQLYSCTAVVDLYR
jgi:hypothetical protein